MWDRTQLKAQGKMAFRMNYWKCVVVSIIMGILTTTTTTVSYNQANSQQQEQAAQSMIQQIQGLSQGEQIALAAGVAGGLTIIFVISILLKIFFFNPLLVGCYSFFRENVQYTPADFSMIGTGFKDYVHTFITLFLRDLFITLWTLLLIVPGIVKSYSYRLVPYILAERPDLSPTETITMSRQMMDGNKWNAFILDLSFIGWALLSIITLGIVGVFWYFPYKYNTDAALYLAIKNQQMPA